ncbi:hypothetical protein [Tuwongella immobilis]|uniref:Secreted protein n=1 Tax=Tuwongella immobilis TaxID=692036 RepID=A0A6C2YVG7_9BACT|nr:hypothetical protein [Tuwongella immobilis]VIP05434.1 Uncharacterized protein OS=Candidatus Nitrospira defluvii GN=NIDE1637 PE=4 SV=1 [Tuwongella immobilis]VTS08224.1 Uncharacterized protein OS=Candidatus Nitrospira defluvii GN=NIDE1637 PE=4 SV=1 [Tuwongella immobilis]
MAKNRQRRQIVALMIAGLGCWYPSEVHAGPFSRPSATATSQPAAPLAPPGVWLPVDWAQLHDAVRLQLTKPLTQPTIQASSGQEEFPAKPELYAWLLDHPDRVSQAWPRMGIPCVEIQAKADGSFHWSDPNGSELSWRQVAATSAGRIWYAEGRYRPAALMPLISVKAVAVMHHRSRTMPDGTPRIQHAVDIYLSTDSRAANLLSRMLGPAAPRLAQDGAKQLLFFFAGIAERVSLDHKTARTLLSP